MYSLDHRKCAVQCTEIFQLGACPICPELCGTFYGADGLPYICCHKLIKLTLYLLYSKVGTAVPSETIHIKAKIT